MFDFLLRHLGSKAGKIQLSSLSEETEQKYSFKRSAFSLSV